MTKPDSDSWRDEQTHKLAAQFRQPHGPLGHTVGQVLAIRNRGINEWTIDLLEIQPTDHVLEIGFGPGVSIEKAAGLAVHGRVVGIDPSDVMMEHAQKRNAEAIAEGRVTLQFGTVSQLDFAPGSFDKIVSVNSVQIWPEPVKNMRTVRQLMRSGGRIAMTLCPRWVRSMEEVRELGEVKVQEATEAGFEQVRLEMMDTPDGAAYSVVAVAP